MFDRLLRQPLIQPLSEMDSLCLKVVNKLNFGVRLGTCQKKPRVRSSADAVSDMHTSERSRSIVHAMLTVLGHGVADC